MKRIELATQMKMTALRGCPFLSTLPIQEEPGRMPSRAMAETRREAATIQMDMFCRRERGQPEFGRESASPTHDEQPNDRDQSEDNLTSPAEREGEQQNERLRSSELEQLFERRRAEEEQQEEGCERREGQL